MIDINNFFWHECEVTGFITTFRNFSHHTAQFGVKGYVKRNAFTPEYLQIIAPTIKGYMFGWYVKDIKAPITVGSKVSPDEPNRLWHLVCSIKERNNSLAVKESFR